MRDRTIFLVGEFEPFELPEQIPLNDFHVRLDTGFFVCVAHSSIPSLPADIRAKP
jgi:hypothetical protein